MDLASKDSYIQKLASRVVSQREQEPKRKPFGNASCVFWTVLKCIKLWLLYFGFVSARRNAAKRQLMSPKSVHITALNQRWRYAVYKAGAIKSSHPSPNSKHPYSSLFIFLSSFSFVVLYAQMKSLCLEAVTSLLIRQKTLSSALTFLLVWLIIYYKVCLSFSSHSLEWLVDDVRSYKH